MLKTEQMTTLEKKIERFSRILGERPGDELTILALAEACFRRGLKLEALTAYQDVVGGRPVPEANLAVAEIYSAQGMPQEAYGELRQLFEVDPDNVEARLLVNSLQAEVLPPPDLLEIMSRPASDSAFDEARLRLKIQRSIYNRELQERTRNVTLEPDVVIHEYYVEEAKKKMIRVEELLRELQRYQDYSQNLALEPRADAVSARSDEDETVDLEYTLSGDATVENIDSELFVAGAPDATSTMENEDFPPESETLAEHPSLFEDEFPPTNEVSSDVVLSEISLVVEDAGVELDSNPSLETGLPPAPVLNVAIPDLDTALDPVLDAGPVGISVSDGIPVATIPEPDDSSGTDLLNSIEQEFSAEPMENLGGAGGVSVEQVSTEFQPDFLESPLDSDLPDLTFEGEPLREVPQTRTMIDLEPIEMGGSSDRGGRPDTGGKPIESPHQSLAPPTFSDAPVRPDPVPLAPIVVALDSSEEPSPVVVTPADLSDQQSKELSLKTSMPEPIVVGPDPVSPDPVVVDSDPVPPESIVVGLDPVAPDPVEVAPDPGPPEPTVIAEFLPAPVEPAKGLSAARKAFYQTHAEALSSLTTTLAKTRGVTSIYLVAREGMTIEAAANDQISEKRIGELVKESFEFLEAFAKDPAYWVLECGGGIFVMQKLDERHVLIAIGQAGANFGALRYTMDKTRAKFEQILTQTPD